jgi:precorrin-2/cobalt-factor-2 C20-methyltransferase
MTLKAVRIIESCPVVAAPRTASEGMVALEIARGAVSLEGKEILPLDFTMSRDAKVREEAYEKMAAQLAERLDRGLDVAMLSLGDVSLYASFQYMAERFTASYPIEMIPGVPSFCAAASRLGISLTEMDKPLHLIPGGADGLDELTGGTRIYMKSGRKLGRLIDLLEERGELKNAVLVQNCGMANERVLKGKEAKQADGSYFSLIIVKA